MSLISTFYFGNASSIVSGLESDDSLLTNGIPQQDFSGGISAPFLMPEHFEELLGVRSFDSLVAESFSPANADYGTYRLRPDACLRLASLDTSALRHFCDSQKSAQVKASKKSRRRGCLGSAVFWKVFAGIVLGLGANYLFLRDYRFLIALGVLVSLLVGLAWFVDSRKSPRTIIPSHDWLPEFRHFQAKLKEALDQGDDIIYHWSL
jgi:hypothetical protein